MSKLDKKLRTNLWAEKKTALRVARFANKCVRPGKGEWQAWITPHGKCYHPFWCATVNGVWLAGSNSLQALGIREAEAGGYRMCPHCDGA